MDGSGHQLPPGWLHPGPYAYDPYTNTFVLPLPYYGFGYGSGVHANQRQAGPIGHHQVAGAQRGGRVRGRRQPRQHDGPGLLGSNPSSQRPPQLPTPRRSAHLSQPPAQVQVQPPPPPAASSSPRSSEMNPPVSDPVKDDCQVDVSMTAAAATTKKSDAADVSMAHRDEGKGDALGLNKYMERKRLLSTKASPFTADATDAAEEEANKTAARNKKTRLSWGQGLAKYERFKKDDLQTTHKLVAHDGATGEQPVSFHRSSTPSEADNSDTSISGTSRTSIAVSELPPDESCTKFTKGEDNLPTNKVIVKMARPIRKIKPTNVFSDEEPQTNENDAAPLVPGISTVTATKNYKRVNSKAEDVKKPVNQICHDSTADLLAHSLPDKGHGESSMDEHEHATGQVLLGESNAVPSPLGMRSIQAACLTISRTSEENFSEENSSNEAVCIAESASKVKENVPQSVLIANHGDEGNYVAGGLCGQDTVKIMFFPNESSAKLANDTFNGDQLRNGAKTPPLCSSLKEWKGTEKKLANSNIDDDRIVQSDMKTPNSKGNPGNTSDPAAMLTGPAFVKHMMEVDEALENKESEKNGNKVCEVNSQKEMERVDNIPSPEGNHLNADMENPTKDSSPCVATNASAVRDDGPIQRLRASEALLYRNSENSYAKVKSMEENLVRSGIELSCNVTCQKGKGIISSPEVNDPNAPPMDISNEAPKTFDLASSSGYAALDIFDANSSYVAMDIDLNIPLDVTPLDVTSVDKGKKSIVEASMGPSSDSEATDSDATMEISPSQTSQQQPANNQPGSVMLFGRVIYQAPSTGTTHHTPNEGNQTGVLSSSNVLSNPVVPVIRRRGRGPVYPSWATTTSVSRGDVPNNQQGQEPVLPPRMLYGGLVDTASVASPLQHGAGSRALVNLVSQQQGQQALANITPYSIMRGAAPPVPSPHLIQGSSGGTGFALNFGFNSIQRQWPNPVVATSINLMVGYPPSYYNHGATANQAPATDANTMLSLGTNNGEGASTSNTRAPLPAAGRGRERGRGRGGRGRGGGPNAWLSLRGNNQE